MTDEELDEVMSELEESRRTVKRKLESLEKRSKVIEDLEKDRDAILESYARMVSEELSTLPSEDRHQIYKMLRLQVTLHPDQPIMVTGTFVGDLEVSK